MSSTCGVHAGGGFPPKAHTPILFLSQQVDSNNNSLFMKCRMNFFRLTAVPSSVFRH